MNSSAAGLSGPDAAQAPQAPTELPRASALRLKARSVRASGAPFSFLSFRSGKPRGSVRPAPVPHRRDRSTRGARARACGRHLDRQAGRRHGHATGAVWRTWSRSRPRCRPGRRGRRPGSGSASRPARFAASMRPHAAHPRVNLRPAIVTSVPPPVDPTAGCIALTRGGTTNDSVSHDASSFRSRAPGTKSL
jgi:hypothetical protein